MKKLLFLSFFGLFLLACTTDEGDGAPFVTDVVMPPSSQLFAPGDEVTVAARGFEADDDIMLRIAWPLSQAALPEGYADGVWAVVTERTESDITFLAPGGYPASTTEVKLFRRGKATTLGKISVSDGRPPEEPSLYGIEGAEQQIPRLCLSRAGRGTDTRNTRRPAQEILRRHTPLLCVEARARG